MDTAIQWLANFHRDLPTVIGIVIFCTAVVGVLLIVASFKKG